MTDTLNIIRDLQSLATDLPIIEFDPPVELTMGANEAQPTEADALLCAECGGKCCKQSAGTYWPDEVGLTVEALVAMARHDDYAIDWWDGDIEGGERSCIYWIRPAHKDAIGKCLDASWGGECVHLTPEGCRLPYEKRPKQCRALKPLPLDARMKNGGCYHTDECSGKEGAAHAWRPHQALIDEAVKVLEDDDATE